ncbi:LysR family transcriptional regulator [Vibrio methylphosphonaticus]|uniref:LysR family transcriptional regulator n=1 Tax=Vibrio methylphosphonaticus TaxID=2946866 RepID=UPI00202A61FA|nr:LysR family transcriptional regulator [Vibrio methylphosphonaticus]MCL9773811.1 LysR family transcriptional regulator [Vibrio methylphosphonaticus]
MALNKSIKYFLAVAKHGNIKRASDELYLSQPSLTSAIKKLESELGAPLFNRLSKGVELTAYGTKFRAYAQEQQEQYFALKHQFNDMQQRQFGKIKIGTGEVWWDNIVKPAVIDYQQQNPASSFHLEFGNNLTLLNHLVQGDIDLFVGHEVLELSEHCRVSFEPLFQDYESIYVGAQHPLVQTGVTHPESRIENVHQYPLLRVTPSHPRHQSILAHGLPHDRALEERIVYDIDSVAASIDMLKITPAVMPYSHHANEWLTSQGLIQISTDRSKVGNIGIYTKMGEPKVSVTSFCSSLRQLAKSVR